MKYILMLDGCEVGRYKSLAKAKSSAEQAEQIHSFLGCYTILECLSEWEFQIDKKYSLKEKKF